MCVSEKKETNSSCGCFLRGANNKFSDNRHVLIDVSALLTETTGGLHQGIKDMSSFVSAWLTISFFALVCFQSVQCSRL